MIKTRPSLIRRAIIYFITTIIVFAVLGVNLLNYYSDQFLEDISRRNYDLAHHVKEYVKVFLEHHVAEMFELRLIIDSHDITEIDLIRKELDHINAFHPLLEQVQILDKKGFILQVSPYNEEHIGIDMSGYEGFQNAIKMKGSDVYWSDSFISPHNNDPAVTISLPSKYGVLMALLNLKELSNIVGSSLPTESETIVITDRRGVIIAHPNEQAVLQVESLLNLSSIRHALEGRVGTYEESWKEGRGLSSVTAIEGSGWVVAVFQEEKMALGVVYDARRVVIIAIILLLTITMMMFLILQCQGMKPIRRLEEMADLIAAGRYGEDLDGKFLELSGFVDSFNKMTNAVRSREEELIASEERFRVLFNEAAEPVYLMDGQGDLIAANKRACQSLGYSPLELNQMNVSQFIVGQDRAIVTRRFKAIAKGEVITAEGEHQRKDGTVFPVEVRIARMEVDDEDRYIAHARDISERKKAEGDLKQSEERFRTAFITSPDAISISRINDGTLINVNEGFGKLTGWERGEVIGKASSELGIFVDESFRTTATEELKRRGSLENLETEIRTKDGRLVSVLMSASTYAIENESHMLTVVRDMSDLKEAQSSLREAYHLMSTIIDSSPLGIVQTDLNGVVHLWNPAAERIFGWKADEVINKPTPTVPVEKRDEFKGLYEKVLAGEYLFGNETQRKRKDGSLVNVSISLARILLESGDVEVMGIVEDITEKKAAEAALRESEERLRKISEGVFEGIVITENGVILESNNQIAEMLGYDQAEIIGKSVMEFVAPEWKDLVLEKIKAGHEDSYEHESVRKDGSFITVEVQGNKTTYQGKDVRMTSIRDITDQKRAENVLLEREKRYRLLYDNNPLSYQSLSERGLFNEVNSAWLKMTGYETDDVIGRPFLDFVSDDYKDVVRENFPKLIKKGEIQVPDLELVTSDGQKIHVTLFGRASVDEETGLMKTHCLLHDITERTRMEDALKKGAQLAAVGQVASGIAHEINNPLATISASTEALLARLPKLKKETGRKKTTVNTLNLFQEYLTMIMDEVSRSSQIIRDLLDFSRVRDYAFARTDVAELIFSTVPLLSVQSRMSKHTFEVDTVHDLPDVRGDRDRLRQVLIILLTNAVESMPEGGNISIKSSLNKRQKTIALSIVDACTGVKKELQQQIFQPFYTTKEPGSGTGLGLSIADTIITKHGGRIEVKTNRTRGANFTVTLPLYDPAVDDKTEGKLH